MLITLLKEDIEFLLSKGIRINKLVKMDALMGEIIDASPELSDITILDKKNEALYLATKKGIIDFQRAAQEELKQAQQLMPLDVDPNYNFRIDLLKGDKVEGYISANASREGHISTNISKEAIFAKLWEITLNSATILVISMLFFVEMLILIFQFIERQVTGAIQGMRVHYGTIRPAAFLFLFGIDISISFLPLYMEKLYEPIFGLSKDMVMGLPISVRMFFTGISFFIAGIWMDRRGWHEPFFCGLFLSGAGILYSWLAPDAFQFIISRAVFGLGYGFALMAAQGFIFSSTREENRVQGLANLWAGVYAGSICGGAAGAMLAERIGYSPVFFLGAVIIFSVIAYALLFMRSAIRKPQHSTKEQPVQSLKIKQIFRFLFNRNVFSLIVFSSIPTAVAIVGFINYFSPVYLNRIGASQSNIGRILMIYGLCLIYIAPFISKYVDASKNKKQYIVLRGILGSLAFIIFYSFGGINAVAVAILLVGIASSIGLASQSAYVLKLKITQEIGTGQAMGVFSSASRVGQVLGPIIFGGLLVTGFSKGITYFGLAYLMITLLFLLLAQSDRHLAIAKE